MSLTKRLQLVTAEYHSYLTLTWRPPLTQYLRDDYLKLRVSAIVYSTPLLPLTPAWQDSLSTTQSGAQFTITKLIVSILCLVTLTKSLFVSIESVLL